MFQSFCIIYIFIAEIVFNKIEAYTVIILCPVVTGEFLTRYVTRHLFLNDQICMGLIILGSMINIFYIRLLFFIKLKDIQIKLYKYN